MSAVFTRRQAPRFEGLNGDPITLLSPPEDNNNEEIEGEKSPPQKRRFRMEE